MKIILASLLLFMSFSSDAMTGNELYEAFNESEKEPITLYAEAGKYQGYVLGVIDVYVHVGLLCWGGGVTKGQVFDVVGKYLKSNPEFRHEIASRLIFLVLYDLYPCKKL